MNHHPVVIYDCEKAPEGASGWITSITDRGELWLLWVNDDGTKSRAKVTLSEANLYAGDRMLVPKDIANLWQAGQHR